MPEELESMYARMNRLERQLRVLKIAAVILAVLAIAMALGSEAGGPTAQCVDAGAAVDRRGRAGAIATGAGPLDSSSDRRMGLRINDASGVERFGVAFMDNGNVVLGLDAPPGTGNDANRERITLVADAKGGAYIRFLDRRTNVVSRMYLDDQNRAWMSFSDFTQAPAVVRRYGLSGEEVLRPQQ